ncbi:MAG: hypothetical protein QG638_2891 [Pseudomonadota bacterium]|jgi:hypothetical protein|nr:hypothetical protein [Pseudomonadota bacterium]MDQ5907429.1 hypothetical protein [Pseudomonadota bacterium]MDQ5918866.1 hypothetical protein [Pseudomonadota bacterium]MDQ5946192.1 hypothetical protein [Pseudomonadota bacterium]
MTDSERINIVAQIIAMEKQISYLLSSLAAIRRQVVHEER